MEQFEKDEERIIIQEQEARRSYVPLTKEQQRTYMEQNWIEVVNENGQIWYIPKQPNETSENKTKKIGHVIFVCLMVLLTILIVFSILYTIPLLYS